jgi:dihydroorotate dehydrogenase
MMRMLGAMARPWLMRLDPETAHRATINALRFGPRERPTSDPRLAIAAFGLTFPNPLGLAAGFDKNAEVPDALLAAGFGFVEIGTLTPRPQRGNEKPRLFRLQPDGAIVNRLGFNNGGYEAAHARLARRGAGIIGVNIGANKDSADRAADYAAGIRMFSDVASYFAINVSSPNTPGLRDLQQRVALDDLVARALDARASCSMRPPILIKIAPDVDEATLDDIVGVARTRGIDGMIISNTTISRPPGLSENAREAGGLSGRPLFALSTRVLARTYLRVEGAFPLIGAGGVDGPEAAFAKIEAGASLVQIYTALIYRGPRLIDDILAGLSARVAGGAPLAASIGASATDWSTVGARVANRA